MVLGAEIMRRLIGLAIAFENGFKTKAVLLQFAKI
jgi:hypothetical protein